MTDAEKSLVPCFLCGNGLAVRYSKREKPYLVCDPCGIQVFIRGKRGIQLLTNLRESLECHGVAPPGQNNLEINALMNRLAELKVMLEKAEPGWLDSLLAEKLDPGSQAIKTEISKIERRLEQMAKPSA